MFTSLKRKSQSLRFVAMAICALFLMQGTILAQNISVSGKVTDKRGEPVVGAFVLIQGTRNGATTILDGTYSIKVPANGVLEVSSMGYKTAVVPVNNRAVINVTIEEDALMLEDVVIVGFGSQKKESLTGAVSTINAQKTLESRPIADVGRGLQGAAAGLNVRVGSSEVGSEPIMRIRGQIGSAIGGSSPLILLDNVEIPSIQMLNPDDIESISILKDAASASIYGAKAAFGVILISSKKGAKEQETVKVTYSGNMSFQNMAKKYQMADVDALQYSVEAAERTGMFTPVGAFWKIDRKGYEAAKLWKEKYGKTLDPYDPYTYGRDWYLDGSNRRIGIRTFDPYVYLVKGNAPTSTHNLSIAGNKGKTSFNVGLGILDQSGMMKTTNFDDFQRQNASVKITTPINKFITVYAGLMFSRTQKRWAYATSSTSADIWLYTYRWGPTYPMVPIDEFGSNMRNATYETSVANAASDINAYTSINAGTIITPVKDWNIKVDYTWATNQNSSWRPGTSFFGAELWYATPANVMNGASPVMINNEWNDFNSLGVTIPQKRFVPYRYTGSGSNPDHVYRDAYVSARQTINATTDFTLKLADSHRIITMAGVQAVSYENVGHWGQKTVLLDYSNPQFNLATGTQTTGGGHSWNSQLGFFGRLNYDYKDKYLLEASIRYDGSSKFPGALKWRWFPSVSGGWRVTEEPWMQGTRDILSSLKLRGSYGMIGDQSVSNSLYIPTMGLVNSGWIHNGAQDVYFSTPASVMGDITWQDIYTLNAGVDLTLFRALNVTFEWYKRDTKNMIVGMEGIGYGFGTASPQGNFGDLCTRGWELTLNYGHSFKNGFNISATATIADAVTDIIKYGTGQNVYNWYNGKRYGEIWGYRVDRLYQNDDFERDASGNLIQITTKDGYKGWKLVDPNAPTQGYLNSGSLWAMPGDVKFKDLNGDGVINDGKRLLTLIDDPNDPNFGKPDYGDLTVIGNTTPRYEYSFRVDMDYKGIDFAVFFQGIGKRDMWGSSQLTVPGYNSSDGAMAQAIAGNFWYETKDASGNVVSSRYDAFYPRAVNIGGASGYNMRVSDKYLLNMAYLRLKNVTLGYTLPKNVSKKALIDKFRVYVSLENFLTFDNLRGLPLDPEEIPGYSSFRDSYYNMDRAGVGAPAFKSASVGLQITF